MLVRYIYIYAVCMNPDETVNGKIFKLYNKEMWNGKDSSLIEFINSNTAQDSIMSSHLLQQINILSR